jgi:OmpA-OmpF porin, OOP family
MSNGCWDEPPKYAVSPVYGAQQRCAVRMRAVCLLLSVYALVWAKPVHAQDVQRFHPALSDGGFLGIDATRTPGSLRGAVHAWSDLSLGVVELRLPGGNVTPVQERLMLHLGGELGLGGRLAVGFRLPLIVYQDGAYQTKDSFNVTDPQLWARYRLIGTSSDDENEPQDGPGLALQGGVTLPVGGRQAVVSEADGVRLPSAVAGQPFASDGAARTEVALLGDFHLLGAGAAAYVGYRHHFWARDGVAASATGAHDELSFGAALKFPLPALPQLAAVAELRGVTGMKRAADTALELAFGARVRFGAWLFALGAGFGLTQGVGSPDVRVVSGLYFVPPRADSDHDGVDDSDDQCSFLAEDSDGFQDEDGCPDPDNDNDLVPDLDDKCPNQPAEEGRDDNEDGCTDA